jgi:hypothetical protein
MGLGLCLGHLMGLGLCLGHLMGLGLCLGHLILDEHILQYSPLYQHRFKTYLYTCHIITYEEEDTLHMSSYVI